MDIYLGGPNFPGIFFNAEKLSPIYFPFAHPQENLKIKRALQRVPNGQPWSSPLPTLAPANGSKRSCSAVNGPRPRHRLERERRFGEQSGAKCSLLEGVKQGCLYPAPIVVTSRFQEHWKSDIGRVDTVPGKSDDAFYHHR